MTRDEAVTVMLRKLSFRKVGDDHCIAALKTAQRQLEDRAYILPNGMTTPLPWFLINRDFPLTLVPNQEYIDLTADAEDFLGEVEDFPPYFYGLEDNRVELSKSIPNLLRTAFPGSGVPQGYYIQGNSLYMAPAPDSDYILYATFYERDDPLDTNIENLWLKHCPDLMIGIAGEELAGDVRDKAAKPEFQRLIVLGASSMWRKVLDNEESNRRTAIGVAR